MLCNLQSIQNLISKFSEDLFEGAHWISLTYFCAVYLMSKYEKTHFLRLQWSGIFWHLGDAVWNIFDHLWTFLVHWKLAQKFSTHFIKSFKNVVPSTHAKTWLYFPLFFQTRSAKFPGYKESQFIKQQILRLFGSLPFGQLRVLVVAKGQKISEDLFKLAVR